MERSANTRDCAARWSGLALIAVVLGAAAGCYERVIRAKGFGAGELDVQKPYANNTALDNALMGPPPDPKGHRRVKRAYTQGGR